MSASRPKLSEGGPILARLVEVVKKKPFVLLSWFVERYAGLKGTQERCDDAIELLNAVAVLRALSPIQDDQGGYHGAGLSRNSAI